jgi:hypothetical protein
MPGAISFMGLPFVRRWPLEGTYPRAARGVPLGRTSAGLRPAAGTQKGAARERRPFLGFGGVRRAAVL